MVNKIVALFLVLSLCCAYGKHYRYHSHSYDDYSNSEANQFASKNNKKKLNRLLDSNYVTQLVNVERAAHSALVDIHNYLNVNEMEEMEVGSNDKFSFPGSYKPFSIKMHKPSSTYGGPLYHATTDGAHAAIMAAWKKRGSAQGVLRPGTTHKAESNAFGAGVYFATTPPGAMRKAIPPTKEPITWMFKCAVWTGNMKKFPDQATGEAARDKKHTGLLTAAKIEMGDIFTWKMYVDSIGADSIYVTSMAGEYPGQEGNEDAEGAEVVVYNREQTFILDVSKIKK